MVPNSIALVGRRRRAVPTAILAGTLSLGIAPDSFAQEGTIEEIIATGSRIARPADRPQPILALGRDDVDRQFKATPAELFKDLPVTAGNITLGNNEESGESPTSSINLRGVGARGTLVLLNGRRQTVDSTSNASGVVAVDVNNLVPGIMIERVETVLDGASAIYGSDAVSGVVNFITRKNFDGLELRVNYQGIEAQGSNPEFGAIFGAQGERSRVVAAVNYAEREILLSSDVFSEDRLAAGNLSTFGNPGSFTPGVAGPPPAGRFPDPLCGDPSVGGVPLGGILEADRCGLLLSYGRAAVAGTERLNAMVTTEYDMSDSLTAGLEFGYANNLTSRPSGFGFPIFGFPVVGPTNPGLIEENARSGLALQDYRIWYRVGGPTGGQQDPQIATFDQDTWRVVGTLDGEIGDDWTWNLAATRSENNTVSKRQDTIFDRFQDALNCQGGASGDQCWNPFANSLLASPGDPEYNDPELLNYFFVPLVNEASAELTTAELTFSGSLSDSLGLAVGAQWREQSFSNDYDPIANGGGFAFFDLPFLDFEGTTTVTAAFAELGWFATDDLEINLAGRYEDYDTGFSTFDPKLSVLYTPTDSLFLRASVGTSFRAPGELQLFGALVNPSNAGDINGEAVDAIGITSGDATLDGEEANTFTAGITFDATDNLTLELNYWRIEFEDLIVEEDAELILQTDLADGEITDPRIILRDGAPTSIAGGLVASDIDSFELSFINQDSLETDGIDFRVDYSIPTSVGEFGLDLRGTATLTYDVSTEVGIVDGAGFLNTTNAGEPIPDWRATLIGDWVSGDHYGSVTIRHIPKVNEDSIVNVDTTEDAFTIVDLLYAYDTSSWFGTNSTLTVGVGNVTDEEPPIQDGTLTTVNTILYDPRGRTWQLGLRVGF